MWFRGSGSLNIRIKPSKTKSQTLNPLAKPLNTTGRAKSSELSSSANNGLHGRGLLAATGLIGNLTPRSPTLIHRAHGGIAGLDKKRNSGLIILSSFLSLNNHSIAEQTSANPYSIIKAPINYRV